MTCKRCGHTGILDDECAHCGHPVWPSDDRQYDIVETIQLIVICFCIGGVLAVLAVALVR